MKSSLNVAVGCIVTFGLLCINGINNAIAIIGLSIICTAGVSLILWIPLWWLVGWIVLTIYGAIANEVQDFKEIQNSPDRAATSKTSLNQKALLNYIKLAKSKGFSDSQISTRLRVEGWNETEIETAQQLASENAG